MKPVIMISAVVLGAGRSSRFGGVKQLLKVGKKTLLETVVGKFLVSRVGEVVVVLGYRADEIIRTCDFGGARVVVNRNFEAGLSSSIRVGIDAVDPRTDAAVLAHGDQLQLSVRTINKLVRKYSEVGGPIVAPYFQRRRGNPILFDRSLFAELRNVRGDNGAKEMIDRMEEKVVRVQVEDLGVLLDIDTEEDYRRFRTTQGNDRYPPVRKRPAT
jgi:molybdenum cofactor cytidylyltransferase